MIPKEQNAHSQEGKGRMTLGPSFVFLAVDFADSLAGTTDCSAEDSAFLAVAADIPFLAAVDWCLFAQPD